MNKKIYNETNTFNYMKKLPLLTALLLCFFPAFANPLAISPLMNTTVFLILIGGIIIFITFTAMEFGVIFLALRKRVKNWVELLKAVLFVNLITFPITQIFALFLLHLTFKGMFFYNFHFIAELFPFIAEFFLLKWQFGLLYKSKAFSNLIKDDETLVITVAANALTFFLGVMFIRFITLYGLL